MGWVEWGLNKSYGYPFEFCVEKVVLLGENTYPVVWMLPGLALDLLVLLVLAGSVGPMKSPECQGFAKNYRNLTRLPFALVITAHVSGPIKLDRSFC